MKKNKYCRTDENTTYNFRASESVGTNPDDEGVSFISDEPVLGDGASLPAVYDSPGLPGKIVMSGTPCAFQNPADISDMKQGLKELREQMISKAWDIGEMKTDVGKILKGIGESKSKTTDEETILEIAEKLKTIDRDIDLHYHAIMTWNLWLINAVRGIGNFFELSFTPDGHSCELKDYDRIFSSDFYYKTIIKAVVTEIVSGAVEEQKQSSPDYVNLLKKNNTVLVNALSEVVKKVFDENRKKDAEKKTTGGFIRKWREDFTSCFWKGFAYIVALIAVPVAGYEWYANRVIVPVYRQQLLKLDALGANPACKAVIDRVDSILAIQNEMIMLRDIETFKTLEHWKNQARDDSPEAEPVVEKSASEPAREANTWSTDDRSKDTRTDEEKQQQERKRPNIHLPGIGR